MPDKVVLCLRKYYIRVRISACLDIEPWHACLDIEPWQELELEDGDMIDVMEVRRPYVWIGSALCGMPALLSRTSV